MEQRYEDDITIELKELLLLIWRRIPIILISALVMALCAFAITKLCVTPTYILEQKICLVTEKEALENFQGKISEEEFSLNKNNFSSDISTGWILNDSVELIKSSQILGAVIEELNLDITLEQLQEMLTVETIIYSRTLSISIEGKNKQEIEQIADAIKQIVKVKIPQLLEVKRVIDVDDGKVSGGSISSDLKKNMFIGAALGAFLVVCIIIWFYIFDDKIKSADDIERHLKLNILGVISSSKDSNSKEAYRTLRTNIQFAAGSDKKVLACVNYAASKKNQVAQLLAASMAETGRKVLYIDADMRKSEAEKIGLVQYLSGQAELKDIIVKEKELAVIAAGVSAVNSTELLDNIKFEELIQEVRNKFDFIIIDTPSIEKVIDGVIIAGKSEVALAVIEEKSVSRKTAKSLQKQLEITGCSILGAVLS